MSQALNNLKKLIIEVVEEEVSTNEYANTQAKKKKQKGLEEKLNLFLEKNTPTNPSKWSYYKSQAKKKFDVYPSAYANAWAAKKYKAAGGGWKKEQIGEASMTGNLDGGEGPPKTPYAFQSKKKRKQDKDKEDSIATTSTGFKKVNEAVDEGDFISAMQSIQAGLDEAEYGFNDLARLRGMSSSEKRIVKTLFSRFKVLMKGVEKARRVITNESINEAKYDIGMARKGNGLTVYNKAEEENGDYKNVAHIDNKGKIKYYDKKVPSKIKKQIEMEAKKMMEITKEGTMKLKDILKESFEKGKVYSNPFHTPFVKENESEESNEMTTEQKMAFLEAVKAYKSFGETVYRNEGLAEVYESIKGLVETAGRNMVKETEGSFDGITVGRHVKRMNESFKVFEKTLREVHTLQQRLESSYDDIGEVLGKYYEINEVEEKVKEGNEFGAARAKAIAAGEDSFEVDGKTYPVKSVDKDDKENAKDFANESKSMKLTSLLNESFGIGDLPSSKLKKMKMTFKEVLELDKDEMAKLHKDGELEKDGEKIVFKNEDDVTLPDDTEFKIDLKHLLDKHKHNGMNEGFSTWEMRFSDMNLGGVKLSKKNVYKVKARNTVEAIKKAAKMAGVGDNWIATETHSLKKIG